MKRYSVIVTKRVEYTKVVEVDIEDDEYNDTAEAKVKAALGEVAFDSEPPRGWSVREEELRFSGYRAG